MHIYLNETADFNCAALIWDGDVVIKSFVANDPTELGKMLEASEYAKLPVAYTWGPEQPEFPAPGVTLTEMVEAVFL